MRLVMMRHGATAGNEEHRYVGKRTDEPLSVVGRAQCARACVPVTEPVSVVYASPLLRARQTAGLCFPEARIVALAGLEEFDFGVFEGRTAQQMEHDADYRTWVQGNCMGECPGGESWKAFRTRSNAALLDLLGNELTRDVREVVVVAHGGTIMAALGTFAKDGDSQSPFQWHADNCCGYVANVAACEQGFLFEDIYPFGRP